MTPRPCIDCGESTTSTRCPDCEPEHEAQRGSSTARGYNSRWQRLSLRARKLQPFCTDCNATEDLQVHHHRWPAWSLRDVEVLCLDCHATRPNVRAEPGEEPLPHRKERPPLRQSFSHNSSSHLNRRHHDHV